MALSSIKNQLNTNYEHLSTMKYSASDDVAVLSIVEGLKSKSSGYEWSEDDRASIQSEIDQLNNKNRIMNEDGLFVQSAKAGQATKGISILLGCHLMDGIL